ncbi:MAG: SulP family inorganic anion transporter, partial [Thermoleophilia bacterium]|nr:SulP family inorganic anion transporter [Thermoleophilia bacterium]
RADLLAGLSVWAVLVPEGMAYADLAGVPPEAGLYAAMASMLLFGIFATSKRLSVGPSSTIAVLSFTTVAGVAGANEDVAALSAALAIMVGAFLVIGGLARLGFISELLGRPVIKGFTIGAAAIIIVGQLPKLFGVETEGDNFFEDLGSLIRHLPDADGLTLVIGAASVALIVLLERFAARVPASLVALVAFIAISALLGLEDEGVAVVGDIPAGLPSIGAPDVGVSEVAELALGALAVAFVAYAETIAIVRSITGRHKDETVDPDREMIALGTANLGAGFAQSFAVDGSLSRSSVNEGAGARSQMSGIVTAVLIVITAIALTPLFSTLPEATLGAIVIVAVWHLLSLAPIGRLSQVDRSEAGIAIACLLGILALGILEGIVIAIVLSFLVILYRAARPRSTELGRVPGTSTFRSVEDEGAGEETYPGLLIFRYDADLFFANANDFRDKVRARVREADAPLAAVIVDAEAIGAIDTTALAMLHELSDELADDDTTLVFARMRAPLLAKMRRFGARREITDERVFYSVSEAVDACAEAGARRAREATKPTPSQSD